MYSFVVHSNETPCRKGGSFGLEPVKYQCKEKNLAEKIKCANYHTKYFCGGENIFIIICKNDKIAMPKNILQ